MVLRLPYRSVRADSRGLALRRGLPSTLTSA